jgi:hypothetical protein
VAVKQGGKGAACYHADGAGCDHHGAGMFAGTGYGSIYCCVVSPCPFWQLCVPSCIKDPARLQPPCMLLHIRAGVVGGWW